MTYSVHQHWDPLKVCAVGISYPPEFYSFIKNAKARGVMERIAQETEEDYQNLIKLLHSFDVKTVRATTVSNDWQDYYDPYRKKIDPPLMCPRDHTAMIGDTFYMPRATTSCSWDVIREDHWPDIPSKDMPQRIFNELKEVHGITDLATLLPRHLWKGYEDINRLVQAQGNKIEYDNIDINTAMITRIGRDLYHGTERYEEDQSQLLSERTKIFPNYRNHIVNSGGHSDGTFCPVKPGLIISLQDIPTYQETFPDWEVVYLPGQSWTAVQPFLDLKEKNRGKFWVPGEEYNDDFTDYVNEWLGNWVGYVEETVFDVNMLVIDEKNVIVNNENDQVFEAFARHGVTPHLCNFRHRYFWDGGIHCVTSDLHREGKQQDYFPNRA